MPRLIAAMILSLLLAGLAGCGNKGPLTMPDQSGARNQDIN